LINLIAPIIGPFGWPNLENGQTLLPNSSGVYLMTVEYEEGYLPFGVGITRRPMRKRFMEHTRSFKAGDYNILDDISANKGVRKIAWKGWSWTEEKRADYDFRKDEILNLAIKQMSSTRIFIVDIANHSRVLERLESAFVNTFHQAGNELIDQGMLLMPRKNDEDPISLSFIAPVLIYGLPASRVI